MKKRIKEDELGEPITVSVRKAKHLSGFGHSKMAELIKKGRLRSKKVDGKRLIEFASLKQLITQPDTRR
jgi:hypothetical protein